jgi:hypothetical protein
MIEKKELASSKLNKTIIESPTGNAIATPAMSLNLKIN